MRDKIIWTIKELYEWAIENGCEDYTVFGQDEGMSCNLYIGEIVIDNKEEVVYL